MRLIGWSREFKQYQAMTDIPRRVQKTEILYWCGFVLGLASFLTGIWMVLHSFPLGAIGMVLAVVGFIAILWIKLWAHIRMCTYKIIMELQLRDKK